MVLYLGQLAKWPHFCGSVLWSVKWGLYEYLSHRVVLRIKLVNLCVCHVTNLQPKVGIILRCRYVLPLRFQSKQMFKGNNNKTDRQRSGHSQQHSLPPLLKNSGSHLSCWPFCSQYVTLSGTSLKQLFSVLAVKIGISKNSQSPDRIPDQFNQNCLAGELPSNPTEQPRVSTPAPREPFLQSQGERGGGQLTGHLIQSYSQIKTKAWGSPRFLKSCL